MSEVINTVKGITLTPPVIGRITLGHTEMRGIGDSAKARPVKDDHFHITTLVQNKTDRSWGVHPLAKVVSDGQEKLVCLSLCRHRLQRPKSEFIQSLLRIRHKNRASVVRGEWYYRPPGDHGRRTEYCLPPSRGLVNMVRCKSMTRAYLQIEGQTLTSWAYSHFAPSPGTLNHLATRLSQLSGLTGGKTAGMPMLLQMESKTSTQSYREPFQFADLVVRPGMTLLQAIKVALRTTRTPWLLLFEFGRNGRCTWPGWPTAILRTRSRISMSPPERRRSYCSRRPGEPRHGIARPR